MVKQSTGQESGSIAYKYCRGMYLGRDDDDDEPIVDLKVQKNSRWRCGTSRI